jgi:hypothetical protein
MKASSHSKTSSSASQTLSRRRFIKVSALAGGAAALGGPRLLRADNTAPKLNVAMIGLGGQGLARLKEAIQCGANIVALCDVDDKMIELARTATGEELGNPSIHTDFHKMLKAEKNLDAVIIATPDHWHAPAAQAAFAAHKHIFCEKPLAHTISEVRELRKRASGSKVVTQLGNQGSALNTMRRGIELIQAGAIGQVRTVHVWVAKSGSFKPGQAALVGEDPVPAGLHWDNWIGPAPFHPYKKAGYHPKAWRAWYDFGGGSMADWGCHGLNLPFRALKLNAPTEIEADVQGEITASYPIGVRIRFDFAARGDLPPVTLWWYDGGRLPSEDVVPKSVVDLFGEIPRDGVLMTGEKGFTYGAPHQGSQFIQLAGEPALTGLADHQATQSIPRTLPRVKGHMQEWIDACQHGGVPYSNFEIGGQLTEIVLAGVVALRAGKKLEWDGPGMRAKNDRDAAKFIHAKYRSGWA